MKKILFPVAAVLLLSGFTAAAQQDSLQKDAQMKAAHDQMREAQEQTRAAHDHVQEMQNRIAEMQNNLNDYDEIVIKKKKDDANEKVTIEIKDDKVLVDGKPIESFEDDAIAVRIRKPNRYNLTFPSSPFRYQDNAWSLENGNANQSFLGVMTEESGEGTRIVSVTENSAAAKAGLKKDDIITKVNDKPVADHGQLTEAIGALKPGDKVTLTYKRDGKENRTTAVLGKRPVTKIYRKQYMEPNEPGAPMAPIPPIPPTPPMEFNFDYPGRAFNINGKVRLGIKVQDTDEGKGVKVLDVDEGSAAEKAGIRENDLITSFDGRNVNSVGELTDASRDSKDKSSVKIQLKRNGKNQEIELKIPKKLRTANL